MESWVYLFSRFSTEALAIELFVIFLLCASYAAYWILTKRRLGTMKETVPTGLVKVYLNELIEEARLIRAQLFGLINDSEIDLPQKQSLAVVAGVIPPAQAIATAPSGGADPSTAGQLQALEARLQEQASAMKGIEEEKKKLNEELLKLKDGSGGGAADGGGDNADLLKKLKELEERLAEYSVIEDDLANLKRLQQENKKLKEAIEAGGGSATAVTSEEAAPEKSTAAESTPTESKPEPASEAPAETEASTETTTPAEPAAKENFDQLADTVDESIQEPAPEAAAAPDAAATPDATADTTPEETPPETAAASEPGPSPDTEPQPEAAAASEPESKEEKKEEKSDDDLLSEFERMLNM